MSSQERVIASTDAGYFANVVKLCRPHQYVKNLFVFMPLFFGGIANDLSLIVSSAIAFIGFSLTASAVYVLNDLRDRDADRQHPSKKHRPIAAGTVSKGAAQFMILMLAAIGLGVTFSVSVQATFILLFYFLHVFFDLLLDFVMFLRHSNIF